MFDNPSFTPGTVNGSGNECSTTDSTRASANIIPESASRFVLRNSSAALSDAAGSFNVSLILFSDKPKSHPFRASGPLPLLLAALISGHHFP